jgi:hypothetical protein
LVLLRNIYKKVVSLERDLIKQLNGSKGKLYMSIKKDGD